MVRAAVGLRLPQVPPDRGRAHPSPRHRGDRRAHRGGSGRLGPRDDHQRDPAPPARASPGGGGPPSPQHPRGHPAPRAAEEAHALRHDRGDRGRHRGRRGGGPPAHQAQLRGDPRLQRRGRRGPGAARPGARLARALHRADAPRGRRDRPRRPFAVRPLPGDARPASRRRWGRWCPRRAPTRPTRRGTSGFDERRRSGRLHQPGERALLRHLQPDAPHRRRASSTSAS